MQCLDRCLLPLAMPFQTLHLLHLGRFWMCIHLGHNIFPMDAYMPTTRYHNFNSDCESIKESLVKCSLVLTEVVEFQLLLVFDILQNGN